MFMTLSLEIATAVFFHFLSSAFLFFAAFIFSIFCLFSLGEETAEGVLMAVPVVAIADDVVTAAPVVTAA